MYVPSAFTVAELGRLHDFIEQHSFGILVTPDNGTAVASHLPFLLDRQAAPNGILTSHIARANPQWQFGDVSEALAIFPGPHAYISPTWYEADKVVPTWNYIAVHAYGRLTWIEEAEPLRAILEATVDTYERSQPAPWKFEASDEFFGKMMKQIVGFQIEITRLEGKWKLNQNHPSERREKVVRALRAKTSENAQAIADAMQATLSQ